MAFKMLLFAHSWCAVLWLFRLFSHCAPNDGHKLNDGILYGSMDGMHLLYFTFHRQIKVKVFTNIYTVCNTNCRWHEHTKECSALVFISLFHSPLNCIWLFSSHWKQFVQLIVCRTIVYRSGAYLIRKKLGHLAYEK